MGWMLPAQCLSLSKDASASYRQMEVFFSSLPIISKSREKNALCYLCCNALTDSQRAMCVPTEASAGVTTAIPDVQN